jgi:hypothetical protein
MPEIVDRVKTERGLLERVASYIPGYHGYKEKELRRESDRLVRQQAAAHLKRASDAFKRSLSAGANLPDAKRMVADRVVARLDLLKERVSRAVGGYAGFFDAVKVREDRLDRIVTADLELVSSASTLAQRVEQVAKAGATGATWSQELTSVEEQISQFEEALQRRKDILTQV